MKLAILLLGVLFTLAACTYPNASVNRTENRPTIAVVGAPQGAVLEVDGVNHGSATRFDGNPEVLLVESGSHEVRVIRGGQVLLARNVFVGEGETRTLTIRRPGEEEQ